MTRSYKLNNSLVLVVRVSLGSQREEGEETISAMMMLVCRGVWKEMPRIIFELRILHHLSFLNSVVY